MRVRVYSSIKLRMSAKFQRGAQLRCFILYYYQNGDYYLVIYFGRRGSGDG